MYETKLRELEGIDERLEISLNNGSNVILKPLYMNMLLQVYHNYFVQARKDSERRLSRYIEDKFNTISGEIQNEFHVRETQLNNTSIGLDEEINKIGDSARVSRADREENDNIILRKVQEELGRISNEVGKERSAREASEQAIYELLKDVVSRVKVNTIKLLCYKYLRSKLTPKKKKEKKQRILFQDYLKIHAARCKYLVRTIKK